MKAKPPKELRDRREQGRRRKNKSDKPKRGMDWKFWFGIALALAGLILGALGLQARPKVSSDAPLNPNDVMTTPFVILNDGALALNDVRINPYIRRATTVNQGLIFNQGGFEYLLPTKSLEPGETQTVPFARMTRFVGDSLISADIALIVSFRPAYLPFWHKQRAFRFVVVHQSDGHLRFVSEPAEDTLQRFNELRKELGVHGL